MQQQPLGANFNFYDGEWLVPTGIVTFLMLFGDFGWTAGAILVVFAIVAFHILYEVKNNMPKRMLGTWRLYTLVAFGLGLFLSPYIMIVYAIFAYASILGFIKKRVKKQKIRPQYFDAKKQSCMRMIMIICLAGLVYLGKSYAQYDDIEKYELRQGKEAGTIAPNDPRLRVLEE